MEIEDNNIGARNRVIEVEVEGCLIGCEVINRRNIEL